ncbi:MAG: hypothetical protein Q8O33_01580 [Pseudomonadota bacterium]|nr:hypothetical protein [Pseudomonadota bacterium]
MFGHANTRLRITSGRPGRGFFPSWNVPESVDRAIAALLDELDDLDFHHPETGARMIYFLG